MFVSTRNRLGSTTWFESNFQTHLRKEICQICHLRVTPRCKRFFQDGSCDCSQTFTAGQYLSKALPKFSFGVILLCWSEWDLETQAKRSEYGTWTVTWRCTRLSQDGSSDSSQTFTALPDYSKALPKLSETMFRSWNLNWGHLIRFNRSDNCSQLALQSHYSHNDSHHLTGFLCSVDSPCVDLMLDGSQKYVWDTIGMRKCDLNASWDFQLWRFLLSMMWFLGLNPISIFWPQTSNIHCCKVFLRIEKPEKSSFDCFWLCFRVKMVIFDEIWS